MKSKYVMLFGAVIFMISAYFMSVPKKAKDAFNQKFPQANHVKWTKKSMKEYAASFTVGITPMSASFDAEGRWLQTETSIPANQLPPDVWQSAKAAYPGGLIRKSLGVESSHGKFYKLEIRQSDRRVIETAFLPDGQPVK